MANSAEVKFQEHFKLNVLFKDYILFENLLLEYNIDYYHNNNENSDISDGTRFFLLDKDRAIIDQLLIDNEIIASTETIMISDYREERKVQKFHFLVYLFVVGLIILIIFIIDFFK
ncbi:hypothetical protein B0I03_10747 [Flavobacterium aquaticum]|uniref:Uncharacterized protein n=1 Tax=Flavobacterium aquaticum TaxID=1236486 RepID=A0A327YHX5_9FLAO|nr:hypothetical protein [Flavobacterium aquaticum]RAK20628.1 hypothetical protein B0I03_10747 [Flavobacterium aquaticum]